MTTREDCIRIIGDLIAYPAVSRDPNRGLLAYVESYFAQHGAA